MSRIEFGDPTWRIHDKIVDNDGNTVRLIFRRWGVDHDYSVSPDVFGYPVPAGPWRTA